jgi:hypothetical protein
MCVSSLSIFQWSYDEDARIEAPGYAIVSAYDSEEGIGYGEGRGTATGQIEGTVVWSNHPRRRSDGRMLPNVRGLVTTHDGASILFELRGRTIFEGDGPGRQNLVGWFESDHKSYSWLMTLSASPRESSATRAWRSTSMPVSTSCRHGAQGASRRLGLSFAPAGDDWFVVPSYWDRLPWA